MLGDFFEGGISMSAELIRESALKCFSIYGYEGTSLSMITEELGMKKQSVYAHFKSKDDLFMSVLDTVLKEEEEFLEEYFGRRYRDAAECFDGFITEIKERFVSEKEDNIKFILHTSYMPPEKLREEVAAKCHLYFQMIEKMVCRVVEETTRDKNEIKAKVLAMTALIDGLFSALLYCGIDVLEQKQKACFELFVKPVYKDQGKEKR
jgi:AcrR family transcriptional regulator